MIQSLKRYLTHKMIIGIDFDNTIVNYDNVFYDVAKKILGKTCPANKNEIRVFEDFPI